MKSAYSFVPCPEHEYPGHPESPARLEILEKRLPSLDSEFLRAVPATQEQIAMVHHPDMIAAVEKACRQGPAIIDYAPTYVTRTSFEDALMAAGGVIACARSVLSGEVQKAFAIIRPPGHHAEAGRPMGFCLFNNIAVGVRTVLSSGLERVMVVDYDAHHGNGTQVVFQDEPRLSFISMHQWGIYPGSGWINDVPEARKRMINVPLESGAGNITYERIMDEIVKPAVESFRPQIFFVSAGFDAYWNDPLTSLGLSTAGYFAISKKLVDLAEEFCEGKIVFVLEGGYDPMNVANGSIAVFSAMAGRVSAPQAGDDCPNPDPDHSGRIQEILQWHGFDRSNS